MIRFSIPRKLWTLPALIIAIAAVAPRPASAQTATAMYAELDRGVYALTAMIAIKSDNVGEFLSLAKARIQQSRAATEVVDFRILATADPHHFVSFESYRSKKAFEAFANSRESVAFLEKIKPILAAAPDVQFLQILP